jgi:hypothetical protein
VELKPFLIPEKFIEIRRSSPAITDEVLEVYGWTSEKLREIGWPKELIKEWIEPLPEKQLKRTFREALLT